MSRYVYKKEKNRNIRNYIRYLGLCISLIGCFLILYFSFPIISWQVYLGASASANTVAAPIPKTVVLNKSTIKTLLASTANLQGLDYTNALTWFPNYHAKNTQQTIPSYMISIPKLKITDAIVSTNDYDLSKHLVHYQGTVVPPEKGNAVIFGHSTLPQLYNPKDYKTIFAYAHTLQIGDTITATVGKITYTYKIFKITVVDPEDTSVLAQEYDDSYLTIITCTPPGTIWKRLIIKGRLEKPE